MLNDDLPGFDALVGRWRPLALGCQLHPHLRDEQEHIARYHFDGSIAPAPAAGNFALKLALALVKGPTDDAAAITATVEG